MKDMIEIGAENGILSVNIDNIPDIVAGRIEDIVALESEVNNSDVSAKKAMDYVNKQMKHYVEKGKGIFKHRSGDTKDIIDDTQEAIEKLASAQQVSVNALKKSFEFQKKLAETSKYLFELGCANITVNRVAVRAIEAKLNGASKDEISELARQEMIAVVKQLKEQEDILKKQEFLTTKVKENVSRLDEKDIVDAEQSKRLEELGAILSNKDLVDQKQEEAIKILFDYTEQKNILDKKQSEEIEKLKKMQPKRLFLITICISIISLLVSITALIMLFLR